MTRIDGDDTPFQLQRYIASSKSTAICTPPSCWSKFNKWPGLKDRLALQPTSSHVESFPRKTAILSRQSMENCHFLAPVYLIQWVSNACMYKRSKIPKVHNNSLSISWRDLLSKYGRHHNLDHNTPIIINVQIQARYWYWNTEDPLREKFCQTTLC